MRNLKKFLALVMAMVMAFSLMLTVNAANVAPSTDFSDNDGITEAFVEAVDVLGGMKVYKGDDTGTLRPGSTITRAETAALIYRLATGDVDDTRAGLYANYGNFADVSENDWFAGYVGYCANAGYIKGHGGYFNPYGNVTGYEALAMVLRAIGYDKNHEFEGVTWRTNVSALGTQLGILDDIKTTDYANTLHLASRRDVVASILFRAAAYVPMVTYTPALQYSDVSNLISGAKNNSLGKEYFGLTWGEGIVVSNQGTGDTKTVWRTDSPNGTNGAKAKYFDAADTAFKHDISLKWETGLKDFGHKYKVWYNKDDAGSKTVYTAYDKVVKTQMVLVNDTDAGDGDGALSGNATRNTLADAASQVGFVPGDKAYYSASFKAFDDLKQANAGTTTTAEIKSGNTVAGNTVTDVNLYLLISNTSGNALDAVVAMNVESSEITQIDNVSATKSIKLPTSATIAATNVTTRPRAGEDRFLAPATNSSISSIQGGKLQINQGKLTSNSTKTLGDYAVNVAIGVSDKTAATAIKNYNVSKIVDTKVGQVVSYNTSAYTANSFDARNKLLFKGNANPDTVTLADGTKLEKSLLYYTVQNNSIPQADYTKTNGKAVNAWAQDQYANITYKFYLDSEGRYIGAEPVRGDKFIYGTYADFQTELSSSSFKYTMTGVDAEGNVVTEEFKSWRGGAMTGSSISAMLTNFHNFGIDTTTNVSGIGRTSTTVNGTTWNRYNGFMLTESGALYDDAQFKTPPSTGPIITATSAANCMQMSPERFGYKKLMETGSDKTVTVDKSGITTGAVLASSNPGSGTPLYLTENTKFIVVSGAGTDSVKSEVFNGITEFLGTSTSVSFPVFDSDFDKIDTFYTVDVNWYANVDNRYSNGVDTIFLNKSLITRTGNDGTLFLPSTTAINVDAYNANYHLLTFYQGDQAVNYWIDQSAGTTAANTSFYNQIRAVGTTSTGETVYRLGARMAEDDANHAAGTAHTSSVHGDANKRPLANLYTTGSNPAGVRYTPTTLDARTAQIWNSSGGTSHLFNVANAKVVNLIPAQLPGVTDVATLNEATSNLTGTGREVYVHFVTGGNTSNVITTIYVCDVTRP